MLFVIEHGTGHMHSATERWISSYRRASAFIRYMRKRSGSAPGPAWWPDP
jgi:hypothetical protein